jgi:hypothetical protein
MAARATATVAAVGGPLPANHRIEIDWGDRSEPTEIVAPANSAAHFYNDARTYRLRAQAYTRGGAKIGGPGTTTFNAAGPYLSGCTPAFGDEAGGNSVIINGGNLGTPTAVLFGSNMATNLQGISPNAIGCNAPAGVGLVSVQAVAPTGTNSVQYEYRAEEEPDVPDEAPGQGV